MPRVSKRTPRQRRISGYSDRDRAFLQTGEPFMPYDFGPSRLLRQVRQGVLDYYVDSEELAEAWRLHRDELLPAFIEANPGRRPWAFWQCEYDGPTPKPGETVADFMARSGVMDKAEKQRARDWFDGLKGRDQYMRPPAHEAKRNECIRDYTFPHRDEFLTITNEEQTQ